MIYAILSLVVAVIIAVGRQAAVFGKVKQALWFFPNFETKRIWFAIVSLGLAGFSLYYYSDQKGILGLSITSLIFILIAFLFDLKYIFPEIKSVERKPGKELNLDSETKIIGVFHKGIAVAYPLDVLIPRHIINDTIGAENIVVSYCAICRSGLVYISELAGTKFYFKVSAVWRRNMGMLDDQTKSLWQQATGECFYGKRKGETLTLLSGENTSWGSWLIKYPNSEYAFKCVEARRGYLTRKGMMKGLNFITPKILPPGYTDLTGLPTRETVFGISYNNISKAYPISALENVHTFNDTFNNKILNLTFDKSAQYLSATEPLTNQPIVVEKHWWLGWKEFHPETQIWKEG